MKTNFIGFYYRNSLVICVWAFLSLIVIMFLSSSVFALQSGDFTYTESGGTVTITGYTGSGGDVVIPAIIAGMPVVRIGEYAFRLCGGLTGVTIPDSVTSIGDGAFFVCTGLTSVTIGNSVTSIGDGAFSNCTGLTSVTMPASVTSIGNGAFQFCGGLTSVTIPASVTSIGNGAFVHCTSLSSIVVDLNNTAYSSQDGVLYDKAKIALILYPEGKSGGFTIPDSVTSIGDGAFSNCTNLTRAYFYGNAPSMGGNVFYGCSSNFTVCYSAGSTGFTNPWCPYSIDECYPAEVFTPPSTTTTTSEPPTTTTSGQTTTTTTTVPVNIVDATSLRKQVSVPIIRDQKNVWMIVLAAGHHFNQQESSIAILGPGEGSHGVIPNERRKAFSAGKFILVPLTIQKGATPGDWTIDITTPLSNPAQEEQIKATFNIR